MSTPAGRRPEEVGTMTPETLAELRRLLDECQPGRVIVNDLRPTHNAIWLDSRYDSDDGWERLRTLAEIDAETETVEVLWGLDDAVLIAAAINALPDLLDAAAERDALADELSDLREYVATTYGITGGKTRAHNVVYGGVTLDVIARTTPKTRN